MILGILIGCGVVGLMVAALLFGALVREALDFLWEIYRNFRR